MAIEQHIGSIITGTVALAGAALGYWGSLKSQQIATQAENNRRRADHLLEKEAELLIQLLEDAEHCHAVAQDYMRRSSNGDLSDEFLIDANDALASFESTARQSKVFLDPERQESVSSLLGTLRKMYKYGDEQRRGRPQMAEEILDREGIVSDFSEFIASIQAFIQERTSELES
ncbi:hypothetical protein E6P09_09465 [Haloferax mediterranei ATCC 33500]|uniref:Uncharacterized protein n=1 Tax=Haloferax mediterranei (strain ATCC 33500 / DSM 1411 / JCM 8866 / NBRC 14739 / NCIMB 2177 / R-4) TaxID=523841 RepID=I3R444_HALMT|nr:MULTISPECIES: hypothetical protein [Haloferacales]AFK19004.1 hypothetical protein HFX_1292 [Haloferax mediterranei ATCC 33500]AHZ21640.1 hypothetical protein BM92_02740 [Haloferax mediterranei ATCC 33500]EMA03556.1 hypothetical protein C439_04055 [Haloferax mediterranei ATCC 33500]MDX5989096.1 hypothetical protein [Haloferax mediterranei ATCC 33500]QCQ75482.1 hypothetical protein E6P09_09465 [Haloferax mediterranei ATCC 33500]